MTAPAHLTMTAQPDGVKIATLGEVCTFKYGKSLAAKDRTGSGNPVYGSNGVIGFHNAVQTDGPAIIVGRKGSYGEVKYSSKACWPIDTTYFIDKTCTDLELEWLKHLLPTLGLNTMNRSAAVPGLNREDAYRIPITVPSLGDQRRIAAILDKADELRAKRRHALAQCDFLTQSIFHNMFGTLSDASLIWPRVPIGEVCSAIVDCVNRTAPLADGPTPYKMIRTSNVRNREIDISNVRYVSRETFDVWNRRATPQRGDIVLTREAPMGEAGQISFDDEVFLGQRTMLYRPNPERLSTAYLLYYLTSSYMKRDFERHGTGTTVKHLSVPYCRSISIHLPPIELQLEFARRIAATERVREHQRAQLAELDVLFAALQHRAFTGDL